MEYTFVDLFAGIGGIRLAFEDAGARCVFSCELDEKARKTYEANFRDGAAIARDIRNVKETPKYDILLAGFPCQPFSIAGVSKKKSLGRAHGFKDETQGTLFFEIKRILKQDKPRAFLLENVKNLRTHDHGRTYRVIMRVLSEELGYEVHDAVIDAKGLVPQHRERIYIVGFREPASFRFPRLPAAGPVLSSILDEKVEAKYTLSDHLWAYLQEYAAKQRARGNGFGYGLADPNGYTRTLSARYYKDGSEILIPQDGANPRRLTPRECAKLQGFPEGFSIVVADTDAYRQFGNSVAVPVVRAIAGRMIAALKHQDDTIAGTAAPMFDRVEAVSVFVRDLDRALDWYSDVLGFTLIGCHDAKGIAELSVGAGRLQLNLVRVTPAEFTPNERTQLRLLTSDTKAMRKHLVNQGVEVGRMTRQKGVLWFWFKDPDGNRLEAIRSAE